MVEHDPETELLPQSQHGEDVIGPVGVVVDDATPFQAFDE